MEIITVTKDNLAQEHICCAISNNNDCQVSAKKSWLAERFDDGLVFKKVMYEANALLSIFLLKKHGHRLKQMDICT